VKREWVQQELKAKMSPGAGQQEPDRIEEQRGDGLVCLALRGPVLAWCGYVGTRPGHRAFGLDYNDGDYGTFAHIEVHGGLTYAAAGTCKEMSVDTMPPQGAELWWLGFDCAHDGDLRPTRQLPWPLPNGVLFPLPDSIYRTAEYVWQQVQSLAQQLGKMTPKPIPPMSGVKRWLKD
jgi:hypothetical protein